MTAVWISSLIFVVCLGVIFSEKVHRTIIALVGAVVMVAAGMIFGFYTEEQAVATIDFNTLGLLLGMMMLVALLEPTGFFQFLAVWVGRVSGGRPVRLLVLLGAVTTLVSMFLDNVTTVVLIAPVTILICEILGYNPQPFLLSEALLSNTGGVATLVGDPPNILIASAAGFTFTDFLVYSLPIVLVTWVVTLGFLRWLFRRELHAPRPEAAAAVLELDPQEAIKDRKMVRRVLIALGLALIGFMLEEQLHVRPSFVALAAAALALVWTRPDVRAVLNRVEWDILLFFASLFILVGGMEAAGVLAMLSQAILSWGHLSPAVLGLVLLWVVAGLSAVVDNVPITIALIPVIQGLGQSGLDVGPLWWALAFGAGFGGNGTIIGSTANVIVASLSERTRHPITPILWSKRGLPVMLVACAVSSLLYVLFFF